jgi:uncharacterized protein involved in exopolysaccharide biosynthesis
MNSQPVSSLEDALRALWRSRLIIVALPLSLVLLTFAIASIRPREFSTTTIFGSAGTSAGRLSQLAGLTASLGLGAIAQGGGSLQSPDFYRVLMTSRDVLTPVAQRRYATVREGDSVHVALADYFKLPSNRSASWRLEHTVRQLRKALKIRTDLRTNMVDFTFTSKDPHLTYEVSTAVLSSLNAYNQTLRSRQYGSEREFMEHRLADERAGLRNAENRVQEFLQSNRDYRNSPSLLFEFERLQREVSIQQQLYTTLAQNFAQSRIEELRNTPAVLVVQGPQVPAVPDSRLLALRLALAGVAGVVIAVAIVLGRQPLSRAWALIRS